ncbi:ribosomal protein S12 methylthiotransferase accessory factor, partial [Streptomyces sp. OspMP-M43]
MTTTAPDPATKTPGPAAEATAPTPLEAGRDRLQSALATRHARSPEGLPAPHA